MVDIQSATRIGEEKEEEEEITGRKYNGLPFFIGRP